MSEATQRDVKARYAGFPTAKAPSDSRALRRRTRRISRTWWIGIDATVLSIALLASILASGERDRFASSNWVDFAVPIVMIVVWSFALATIPAERLPFLPFQLDLESATRRSLAVIATGGTAAFVIPVNTPLITYLGFCAIALVSLLTIRVVEHRLSRRGTLRGENVSTVLLAAHPDFAASLMRELEMIPGARVVAIVTDGQGPEVIHGCPVLGDIHSIAEIAEAVNADIVMVSDGAFASRSQSANVAWQLGDMGISMLLVPAIELVAPRRLVPVKTGRFVAFAIGSSRVAGPIVKRMFDVVGAMILLVALMPVLLAISLAVGLGSPGPIFYLSRRVGQNGREFAMAKFRTMRIETDRDAVKLESEATAGPLFAIRNDPRVTRVGRFLRRYSLDELPQLINVIRGDMSLVGPRPPLPHEVAAYEERMKRRLLVKPGMTGLWQISGRSDLSWDESVRLDVYYTENWTVFMDFLIMAQTLRAVVSERGAY